MVHESQSILRSNCSDSAVMESVSGVRYVYLCFRYDPQTNQWSSDVAPTSSCRTSVGVAVLDNFMYAVGGQDGVSCLNFVERYLAVQLIDLQSTLPKSITY